MKKQKLKNLLKLGILIFGLSLFLTNCEKENISNVDNISNDKINSSEIILQKVTTQQIKDKNSKVAEILSRLDNSKLSKQISSSKATSKNDFYVLKNKGIYIQYREHHSYTFPIFREKKPNVVENLLVSLQRDKSYKTYLVTYSFSDEDLDKIKNKIPFSVSDKMQVEEINFDVSSIFSKEVVREVKNPDGTCNRYTETTGPLGYPMTQVERGVPCSDTGGGGGGGLSGSETGGGSTSGGTTSGGSTGSGGSYGDGEDDGFGGGSGGGFTTPLGDGEDIDAIASELRTKLSLSGGEYLWLKNNPLLVFEIDEFLDINSNSQEAITEAKTRLAIEMIEKSRTITLTWKPNTGTFKNREALKYTHTAVDNGMSFFNLENGQILIASGQQELKISKDTSWTSEINPDGFHYIYSRETKRLYEYKIPPANYPDADIDFLLDAFWTGVATTARYATPLEDAIILIDGKDFDGVEQNKVYTAGFMIVGFIPGGKIMKPISKVVKNSDVAIAGWKVIAKVGDKTVNLSCKVVNGLVDFGSRSKLADIIKTTSLEEAHHFIPWNKLDNEVIQEAAYAGFHMNAEVNGKALQKFTSLTGEGIHGNHPAYDKYVQKRLDDFSNTSFDSDTAKDFLENSLIPKLDELVELAKSSNLNLNEYFKQVVNPSLGIN